ncbi:hypothetical protein [Niabella aquatica]
MRQVNHYIFYVIIVLFALFTTSCNWWSDIWGNHQLGSHLSLWEGDRKEDRVIAYCTSQSGGACVSGIYVVPSAERNMVNGKYAEYVEEATSNKKWVIAKTLQIKDNKENYYIISKDFNIEGADCAKANCDSILQSHVTGPLSLSEFENKKKALNIGMDFK